MTDARREARELVEEIHEIVEEIELLTDRLDALISAIYENIEEATR